MSSNALFQSFLTLEDFQNYEDAERFNRDWLSKPSKLSIDLPGTIDYLMKDQFNAVDYLYFSKSLTPQEFKITDTSGVKLDKQMSNGELTAVKVFMAFAKRGVIAHKFTNCAIQMFVSEGLKQTEERDEYFTKYGKMVGPLHGLPILLKSI